MAAYERSEKLAYNGCKFHNSCFTCPFPDCKLPSMYSSKSRPVRTSHEGGKDKEPVSSITPREEEGQDA